MAKESVDYDHIWEKMRPKAVVKTKSMIIKTCMNPLCGRKYAVATYQSHQYCDECRPVHARCIHGVRAVEPCNHCLAMYGKKFMRAM